MRAYIGLGSNLGDRLGYLARATRSLATSEGVRVTAESGVYETDPVGPPGQAPYLNAVVEVETDLEPEALVRCCKAIEGELGRAHRVRWGPREIDLDVLLYSAIVVQTDTVRVPHPEAHRRGFVLVPLAELNPDLVHPTLGRTVAELLSALPDPVGVRAKVAAKPTAWIRHTD